MRSSNHSRGSVRLEVLSLDEFAIFRGSLYIRDTSDPGRYRWYPCCNALKSSITANPRYERRDTSHRDQQNTFNLLSTPAGEIYDVGKFQFGNEQLQSRRSSPSPNITRRTSRGSFCRIRAMARNDDGVFLMPVKRPLYQRLSSYLKRRDENVTSPDVSPDH